MVLRRLIHPRIRLTWIATLLAGEVTLGFTGYFAGFREPLMMAAVALIETFDQRRVKHWIALGTLAAIMLMTGVLWIGIREEFRADFESNTGGPSREVRLERVAELVASWARQGPGEMLSDLDSFIDRLWAIYYPALAVERVPSVQPHENGALLWRAVEHVLTPRLLFPDKPELQSDSEMVREYSGIWVPGQEENTTIAFGYAAELYVDFGVPFMYLPIIVYGCFMGMAYSWLLSRISHRELAIAMVTTVFWLSLYFFERSLSNTLGTSLTLIIYLGGATLLLDRVLLAHRHRLGRGRAVQQGSSGLAPLGSGESYGPP
jgi:hypothetical protein